MDAVPYHQAASGPAGARWSTPCATSMIAWAFGLGLDAGHSACALQRLVGLSGLLPTQWQVVDLCRIWLDPEAGRWRFCDPYTVPGSATVPRRPALATWQCSGYCAGGRRTGCGQPGLILGSVPHRVGHPATAIRRYHRGTNLLEQPPPMYTDCAGSPVMGPLRKYGWAWRLPRPAWSWEDLDRVRSRTLRDVLTGHKKG